MHGFCRNFQHCLLFIFLILVGVEFLLCIVVTLSSLFSGVKLSIRSFCFISLCHSCINDRTAGDSLCWSCFVGLFSCSLYAKTFPIVESSVCACSRLVKLMGLQVNDDVGLRISSMESLSVVTKVIQFTSPFT